MYLFYVRVFFVNIMAKNVDHSEKMPPPPSAAWEYFKRAGWKK